MRSWGLLAGTVGPSTDIFGPTTVEGEHEPLNGCLATDRTCYKPATTHPK